MASWWDTLNPFSGAELTDAQQARAMGAYQGLLNMGAQMMDAGRPRLVMQEGFGPGLLGGLGRGAAAFGQGMAEGRRNYMQQGLLDEQARGMRDWREAVQALPEADRPFYRAMGPQRGAQALLEDRRTQRQMEEARAFIGGGQRPPAAMEPPAAPETANAGMPEDIVPRIILAEAANQGPEGMAAVAHVIANRARLAGRNPAEIVTAAGQFEPWQTRRNEVMNYSPVQLAQARQIWDAVQAGNLPDPTQGATHFYSPASQRALGRQPPAWAQGEGRQIGGHTFYSRPQDVSVFARPASNMTNTIGAEGGGTTPSPQRIAMAAGSGNPVLERWATTMAPFVRAQARAEEQPETFYGTVQWGQDANGRPVMLVPSNRGNLRPLEPPPGVQVNPPGQTVNTGDAFTTINPRTGQPIAQTPINIRRREAEEQTGQAQGRATANAPQAIAQTEYALQLVDALRNHRALTASTGLTGPALSIIPGTPMYDFRQRAAQLQGQNFLAAFETLRGGGQISNAEGEKATQAIARLNQGLSERDFKQALDELTTILNQGLDRARQADARGVLNQPRPPDAVGSGPPSPPRVGETRDGYRFRGGNPADPQAWERVQ